MDTGKMSSRKHDCHDNNVHELLLGNDSDVNIPGRMKKNDSERKECPVDIYVNGVFVMGNVTEEHSINVTSQNNVSQSKEEEMQNDANVDVKNIDTAVDGLLQLTKETKFKNIRHEFDNSFIKDEKESSSIPNIKDTVTKAKDEESMCDDDKKEGDDTGDQKKKKNKLMSAQCILSSTDKCSDIIVLLENVYNKFRKHPDVNIAINALKEVSNEISTAAFQHLGNYAKEVRKRNRVIEQHQSEQQNGKNSDDVKNARKKCKLYSNKEEEKEVKKTRHVPQRKASSSIIIRRKVCKELKTIQIPKPKDGTMYTPTEMCEILCSKVESSDRWYVLKYLSKIGRVGVKY